MSVGLWIVAVIVALLCAGYAFESLSESRDRRRYPPPGRRVELADGRRMHLFCQGDAQGPTVVIEQGIASPSVVWWPVQAAIAKFARVCTYDRAGFLWSDPAAPNRGLDDRVADLHAVLTRGNVPSPYILVAHSMGGLLVRRFARLHPELVAGLVLVDAPDEAVVFRESVVASYRQGIAFQRILRVAARFGLLRALGRSIPMLMLPDDEMGYSLCVTPAHAVAAAGDLRAMLNASEDFRRPAVAGSLGDKPMVLLAHGIPFPAMVAMMEEGWREGQHTLARLSTDSEVIVAEKSSHLVYMDEPELIVESVRRVHAAVRAGTRLTNAADSRLRA